jgi:hypothetical protein
MLFVTEITNKYHFTSLEAWSMQLIKAVVHGSDVPAPGTYHDPRRTMR